MRKICEKCFREFFEDEGSAISAEELGRICFGSVQDQDAGNFCSECRKISVS